MNYLNFGEGKVASDDVADFIAAHLDAIGLDSYNTIHVDTPKNKVTISFDAIQDAQITNIISGGSGSCITRSRKFQTNNIQELMVALLACFHQAANS